MPPAVAVALFTRDLRVCDNPMLTGAAAAERVVPLFVLDEAILRSDYNRPNRARFLAESLSDLDASLRRLGAAGLVVRRGDPVGEAARVAQETGAAQVHVSADVSGFAQRRQRRLAEVFRPGDSAVELVVHDDVVTVVPPGTLLPSGGDHFAVFAPYHRRWSEQPVRKVLRAPALRPVEVRGDRLPRQDDICPGETSPNLLPGGESAGRQRAGAWVGGPVRGYGGDRGYDDLAHEGTSRLSPYLHFGCVSPLELVHTAGRSQGAQAFVRQLAWRDFYAQLLDARPEIVREDYKSRGDDWRRDQDTLQRWKDGRTGYPVVDAGMRQLAREGWMHNRARLVTSSFLVKTLYVDWRLGAQHFIDLLVDGDTASNTMNWQWIAGTGTDTRPGRVLNPLLQGQRYDAEGAYVRRYVDELAGVDPALGGAVHQPWKLPAGVRDTLGYPDPMVDLAEGRRRFLAARKG